MENSRSQVVEVVLLILILGWLQKHLMCFMFLWRIEVAALLDQFCKISPQLIAMMLLKYKLLSQSLKLIMPKFRLSEMLWPLH